MHYDSPKLLLLPHFSQWRSVQGSYMILTPWAACEGGASTIIPFPHSQHNAKVCPKKAASPCIPTYVKNRRFTVEKLNNRWPKIAVECAIVQKKFRGVKIDDLKTTVNLF